jgi:putative FmdB family regulatory protein
MPNYEYLCPKDGLTIILDLPMEHEILNCQLCGAELRRVYTAVPTIFKGTGWAGKLG